MRNVFLVATGLIVVGALACVPPPPPEPEEQTPATSVPTEYRCSFDTFPDGSPIEGNATNVEGFARQTLEGDEFLECGFSVASAPMTSCVTVHPNYEGTGENYLWLEDGLWLVDGVRCANAWRLEIHFTEPVAEVSLAFSGASIDYVMEVYNEDSELIGESRERAEYLGGVFTTTVTSDAASIAWASFGADYPKRAVVAIKEIAYVR